LDHAENQQGGVVCLQSQANVRDNEDYETDNEGETSAAGVGHSAYDSRCNGLCDLR
jgi:hypothetical protein